MTNGLVRKLVGSLIELRCTVTDEDTPTDPTGLVLTVSAGDGSEAVYRWPTPGPDETAITHDNVGRFSALHPCSIPGVAYWRWAASGQVHAADEGSFIVTPGRF